MVCLIGFAVIASAQETRRVTVVDKDGNKKGELDVQVETEEAGREIVVKVDPKDEVDFSKTYLVNMAGERVNIDLDKVTVVEYWSRTSAKNSLYWNKMRELEAKYKNSPDVQFVSINFDNTYNGKYQRQKADEFLQNYSRPEKLLFDVNGGVSEVFLLTGTSSYMLFDNFKRYLTSGRGDAPETMELFEKMEKAIEKKREIEAFNLENAPKN